MSFVVGLWFEKVNVGSLKEITILSSWLGKLVMLIVQQNDDAISHSD